MKFIKCVLAAAAAALCAGTAVASTVTASMYFPLTANFENGDRAGGSIFDVSFSYEGTDITSASFSVGGYTGSFTSASLSSNSIHFNIDPNPPRQESFTANGRTFFYVVDDHPIDGIPLAGVDMNAITVNFGVTPGSVISDGTLTEANLDAFFANVDRMAFNALYVAGGQVRRNVGGFREPLNYAFTAGSNGGDDTGTGPGDMAPVPLPSSGVLLIAALAGAGMIRRRARSV